MIVNNLVPTSSWGYPTVTRRTLWVIPPLLRTWAASTRAVIQPVERCAHSLGSALEFEDDEENRPTTGSSPAGDVDDGYKRTINR
jgi:hypothetical protein